VARLLSSTKRLLNSAFNQFGYEAHRLSPPEKLNQMALDLGIPNADAYAPLYSPWLGNGDFAGLYEQISAYTLVDAPRCYVLYSLACQAVTLGGEVWECGVYKGGTAMLLARAVGEAPLRLFDTFEGMPETDPIRDVHKAGDFADTHIESVSERVGPQASYHKGFIPETFAGLEDSRVAIAHIDVDLYRSILDCCQFIYPRLLRGGFLVFDDYGFPTCPGARQAVDEFFAQRPEVPLVLPTGQAVVFKSS